MPALWTFLASVVGPLAKRVLFALGIGWVSYQGATALVDQVKSAVIAQWGQLAGSALNILLLGGVGEAIGIVLGGMVASAALLAVARLGKAV